MSTESGEDETFGTEQSSKVLFFSKFYYFLRTKLIFKTLADCTGSSRVGKKKQGSVGFIHLSQRRGANGSTSGRTRLESYRFEYAENRQRNFTYSFSIIVGLFGEF